MFCKKELIFKTTYVIHLVCFQLFFFKEKNVLKDNFVFHGILFQLWKVLFIYEHLSFAIRKCLHVDSA